MPTPWMRYWGLLICRPELEPVTLVHQAPAEGKLTAIKALRLVRSAPPQPMSQRQASEYAAESAYAAAQTPVPAAEGVHDALCARCVPGCLCLRCRRDHSDTWRVCCAEHRHDCKSGDCPDFRAT